MYSPTFIELLAGYARYHQDRRNKVLHAIGIPLLMTSYLYGLSTPLFRIEMEFAGFPLSLGVLLFALCATYWTVLARGLGLLLVILFSPLLWLCPTWTDAIATHDNFWGLPANLIAFCVLNGAAWGFQLAGHYFEKKKPAFLNNVKQGMMGPLFLVFELGVLLGGCKQLASSLEQARHSSSENS